LLTATLLDGSIIETSVVDEILSLENAGSRQIKKISLEYKDKKDPADHQIFVMFQNAEINPDSWVSINFSVVGNTRDWAFLAAADIDERIKRVIRLSPSFVVNNRQFIVVPMAISIALMLFLLPPSPSSPFAADKLEEAYRSGLIKDPIQALILLERARGETGRLDYIAPMMLAFLVPWIILFGLGKLFSVIAPPYNFYWGDYIGYYNKRRSAQNIFWTVVVLGIIVSIISAYIMRFLP